MNGLIYMNKSQGMTSHDVVNVVRKKLGTKKVGHTGTLDPLATGVLIVCVGTYTKLTNLVTSHEKEYKATMRLGIETDTGDITGHILKEETVDYSESHIIEVFHNFPKEYLQTVPIYSAVKINGKKLYEYARAHEVVALPKRLVQIKALKLLKIEGNEITFQAIVSKGTYIRSLVTDIAKELNTIGTMTSLERTKQGNITIHDCISLDCISNTSLHNIDEFLRVKRSEVDDFTYQKILNGNSLLLNQTCEYMIMTYQNKDIALYQKENEYYKIMIKL